VSLNKIFFYEKQNYVKIESILVFLLPVLSFSIKGAANSILFIFAAYSCWYICKNPSKYFRGQQPSFWIIFAGLQAVFVAELMVQLGRVSFDGPALDGPSRAFLSAFVFVYLSKNSGQPFLYRTLALGSLVGIYLIGLLGFFHRDHYWEGRFANYFVDPNTLACYSVAMLGMVLFCQQLVARKKIDLVLKVSCFFVVLAVALSSQSRSSWVALVLLAAIYLSYLFKGSLIKQVGSLLIFSLALTCLYFGSEIVQKRFYYGYQEYLGFFYGYSNSSIGHRLGLVLLDLKLIFQYPFLGISDGDLPLYESLAPLNNFLTKETYDIKLLAGSHNEILAQLVSKGVLFGLFAVWGLFLYPIYFLFWKFKEASKTVRAAVDVGVGFLLPLLVASMTLQVFNLKMTIAFYTLCLSVIFSAIYRENIQAIGKGKL
jgi:hypothetical protein